MTLNNPTWVESVMACVISSMLARTSTAPSIIGYHGIFYWAEKIKEPNTSSSKYIHHTWIKPVSTRIIASMFTFTVVSPPVIGHNNVLYWAENAQVKVYVYSPDIPSRFSGLYINYPRY